MFNVDFTPSNQTDGYAEEVISRAKEISKLNESKYIVLSKTTFGNNTYTTSFYDVVSTTNSYTEYKYLADKKLKNIEITLTLNKERII